MFKIILSPIGANNENLGYNDAPPIVSGKVLSYRGVSYDLSELQECAVVETDSPFIGNVKNVDNTIEVKLEYIYCTSVSEAMQSTDWDDYTFIVEDGQCPDPIIRKEIDNEY